MLGTVQQAAGQTVAALESYRKASAIRPADSTWSNMGTILYWEGDYAEAAQAYQNAIALAPHNPDLYANLGDAQQKLGLREEALASYRRAIDEMQALLAVNDRDATNLGVLAMYHAKVGDRSAAEISIGQALALSAEDGDVLYNRAIVHALAGEISQACAALERAVARGASVEIIRRADELKTLKGCTAYDRLSGSPR
jgi:Flp pilus assembly protein TadD